VGSLFRTSVRPASKEKRRLKRRCPSAVDPRRDAECDRIAIAGRYFFFASFLGFFVSFLRELLPLAM
jgi:hypothetical protein